MNIKKINRYEWMALDIISLLREDLKKRKIKLSAGAQFKFVVDRSTSDGYGVVAEDSQYKARESGESSLTEEEPDAD